MTGWEILQLIGRLAGVHLLYNVVPCTAILFVAALIRNRADPRNSAASVRAGFPALLLGLPGLLWALASLFLSDSTIFLSWRYLVSRRTNLIGIVGIFVGVAALIMILSIMTGFLDEHRKTIRGSLSDLVITPEHLERLDRRAVPLEPERLLHVVRSDPRVAAASAELVWGGMLSETGANAARTAVIASNPQFGNLPLVQIVGIDLADEFSTTELLSAIDNVERLKWRVFDPQQPFAPPNERNLAERPKPSILVGQQLMENMGLERGEVVDLCTVVPDPESGSLKTNNRRFVVAGAFRTSENEMDLERVYVERAELQDLLGNSRGFSTVLVKLKDYPADAESIRTDLRRGLTQLGLVRSWYFGNDERLHDASLREVRTWEQFRHSLIRAIENERVLIGIMLALVLLVAGFTVFAILSMMVIEKRRDIGILTALGATRGGVLATFLLIAFWDALLGGLLGALGGVWAAIKIDPLERWLSSTFGFQIFDRSVYLFDHIPSRIIPASVGAIVFGAFVCTLLFAALPAWRAARMDPLEALRYE